MNELLSSVLEAHGGLAHRNSFNMVKAIVATRGSFWQLKGLMQDQDPCQVTVWLHQEHSILAPVSHSHLYADYMPSRIAILKDDGTVIAERDNPRASFAGHIKPTWWDPLQLAYFEGYALWAYLNTPFLLAGAGVAVMEIDPWIDDGATWRVLRAQFFNAASTHSAIQEYFFDEDFMLRRHDYRLDIAGGFDATHLLFDYVEVEGIRIPSRCRAYTRAPNQHIILDPLMASIEISNVRFI